MSVPDKLFWYKPKREGVLPPSNCRGSVYGIYYTYNVVSTVEFQKSELCLIGFMTREEMLEMTKIGCR